MAPRDKKWDTGAERDLCVAIISGDGRPKPDWNKVEAFMKDLGYAFTRDAMSQHFSKVIMKDFKSRHGGRPSSSTPTPKKVIKPTNKPTTPASRKRGHPKGGASDEDEDSGPDSATLNNTPKKPKGGKTKSTVKHEQDDGDDYRDLSVNPAARLSFQDWLDAEQ